MLHSEHLRTSAEKYEIRHDNNGTASHIYINQYQEAFVFQTAMCMFKHIVLLDDDVETFYVDEEDLLDLYECKYYGYHALKKYAEEKGFIV